MAGFKFIHIHFADFPWAEELGGNVGVDFHISRKYCISPSASDTHGQRCSLTCNFVSSPQHHTSHCLFSLRHCGFLILYYLPQHTFQVTAEQHFCTATLRVSLDVPLLRLKKAKDHPTGNPGLASDNQTAHPSGTQENVNFNSKKLICDKEQHLASL